MFFSQTYKEKERSLQFSNIQRFSCNMLNFCCFKHFPKQCKKIWSQWL